MNYVRQVKNRFSSKDAESAEAETESLSGPPTRDPIVIMARKQSLISADAFQNEDAAGDSAERGGWSGQFDCLMSLVAYAVGLGNVWRFPYLCFKHGGGSFLIPYIICWTLAAVPIFFLEVTVGQYFQRGAMGIWKSFPVLKGVGIANIVVSLFCSVYYCTIVSWALYYLFSSFQKMLPWVSCGNGWNDKRCVQLTLSKNESAFASYLNLYNLTKNDTETPVEQFWENEILNTSDDIGNGGALQWKLALLLLFSWILVYFALWKGITSAKKLIYFCALCPYFLLFILLIRGVTLKGASKGIIFYLQPQMEKLLSATIWKDAGTQVFYSYGIGFGAIMAMGSYNKYNHNCYRDVLMLCCVNAGTSLLAGFVVFSVLGFMSVEAGKDVADIVKQGPGLAFLVYPEVVANLPISQLWSVLFFTMIAILGLDSQVCQVEGVITPLADQFPTIFRDNKKKSLLVFCLVGYISGLTTISRAGQYWLALVDAYGPSGISLLFVVFVEVVGLAWGFGADNIYKALEDMIGFRPSPIWKILWKFTAPAICVIIFFLTIFKYEPLTYDDGRSYPGWSMGLGFMMSFTSMIIIPVYAIYYILCKAPGNGLREKISNSITPNFEPKFMRRNSIREQQASIRKVSRAQAAVEVPPPYDFMEEDENIRELLPIPEEQKL